MNFVKLLEKSHASANEKSATAAFLGDSITQGVFELKKGEDGKFDCIFDYDNVYHAQLRRKLNVLYPKARINIINAGNNGTDAACGYQRLQRDVLAYSPDLVVVCFGTNDCLEGEAGLTAYVENLEKIFLTLQEAGIETIFLTPNLMADRIVPEIHDIPGLMYSAEVITKTQVSGMADLYFEKAKELCRKLSVPVCDCRAKWQKMKQQGVDTTGLLCNHLNHPSREMHTLFAESLLEMIMDL